MTQQHNTPDGLVIVDKPSGFTSHDVVAKIRGIARTRRVGHAGTLDPMATGVLVLGVEKATKLLGHLALTEKEYLGTVRLGQNTVTDDAEGEITSSADASAITRDAVDAGIAKLTGDIMQVPSKVSAIKIDGVRSYKRRVRARTSTSRRGRSPSPPSRCTTSGRRSPRTAPRCSTLWSPSCARPAPTSGPSPAIWAPTSASAAISRHCGAPASVPTSWTPPAPWNSSSRS